MIRMLGQDRLPAQGLDTRLRPCRCGLGFDLIPHFQDATLVFLGRQVLPARQWRQDQFLGCGVLEGANFSPRRQGGVFLGPVEPVALQGPIVLYGVNQVDPGPVWTGPRGAAGVLGERLRGSWHCQPQVQAPLYTEKN